MGIDIEDNCEGVDCNHGTCVDGVGSYECDCMKGFGGDHCKKGTCRCVVALRR